MSIQMQTKLGLHLTHMINKSTLHVMKISLVYTYMFHVHELLCPHHYVTTYIGMFLLISYHIHQNNIISMLTQ